MKKIVLTAVLFLSTVVSAAALDLKQGFTDADGKTPVVDQLAPDKAATCGEAKGVPCLTLGAALFHALLQSYSDEPSLSGEEKFKRGALAMKIMDKDAADFQPAEIAMLKTVVGKLYSPWVIVKVYGALEPGK